MITENDNRIEESETHSHLRVPQSGPEGAEKLDKVRDILFGNEFRSIDQRLSSLDESIARMSAQLRTEFRQHINTVEHALKTLSDDVSSMIRDIKRDKADKLGVAEMLESMAARLREDQESMSH